MENQKINFIRISFVLIIFTIFCESCNKVTLDESLASPQKTIERNQKLLFSIPKSAGTVGTILLAEKQGKLYILLARENMDALPGRENDPKWLSKRGTFSDLGGSTDQDNSQTFLHHIQRELKEESMGLIQLEDQSIIQKSQIIYKVSSNGREIIYIVYFINSPQEFIAQDLFNTKRMQERDKLPEVSLEKDLFLWCEITPFLQENLPEEIEINDWSEQKHTIKLRKFFMQDALAEDFKKIVFFFQKRIKN